MSRRIYVHKSSQLEHLYPEGMGQMKRAEARERALREQLGKTHNVVLRWRQANDGFLLDVLDPHTDERLTRTRKLKDAATIYNLVQRSLTGTRPSPKTTMLRSGLDDGKGQIEIQITGEQYMNIRAKDCNNY